MRNKTKLSNETIKELKKGFIPVPVYTLQNKTHFDEPEWALGCNFHNKIDEVRYKELDNYPYEGLGWLGKSLIPEYKHELNLTHDQIKITQEHYVINQ